MFTVNKALAATAALVTVGFIAAVDMAQSRSELTASAVVAARFPSADEMLSASPQPESLIPDGSCTREHWPYIADECLTGAEGAKVKRPTRTITIERHIAKAQPAQVATR